MQDKALAAIGQLILERENVQDPVDIYIQKPFPGKDWQAVLLVFDLQENDGQWDAVYKGMDIEKVRSEGNNYRKYAYRQGTGRGGDVTLTTKLSFTDPKKTKENKEAIEKKLNAILNQVFDRILKFENEFPEEAAILKAVKKEMLAKRELLEKELLEFYTALDKETAKYSVLSVKFLINGNEKYLRDFEIVKKTLLDYVVKDWYYKKSIGTSKTKDKICSVTGEEEDEIYGLAAPFTFSTIDKPGFIAGFFKPENNWKNYPVSARAATWLDMGKQYVLENLSSSFYKQPYLIIPHPVLPTEKKDLSKIIRLIRTVFIEEAKKKRKERAEERIFKLLAEEKNYFTVDLLFYKKQNQAFRIRMFIEEILPTRFRILFIDVPEKINAKRIYKNAIRIKKNERKDLKFSYEIIKDFFEDKFLDAVNKLFTGQKFDKEFVFQKIIFPLRKILNNPNTSRNEKYKQVLRALMLLDYLQQLNLIPYDKNYTFMEPNIISSSSRFDREKFFEFVKENPGFLDSDLKIGLFALGILVRFLFDLQQANLGNTPFENKLHGYKLNPELLERIYTEALDKIQKYTGFYAYGDLREIIAKYFVPHVHEMKKLSNSELSFYFVAGLELGNQFKRPTDENSN